MKDVRRIRLGSRDFGPKGHCMRLEQGLGRACAAALAEAGCALVLNGRNSATLAATARDLRDRFGVTRRRGDRRSQRRGARASALIAAAHNADILVNNNGGPPFKNFGAITARGHPEQASKSNMLTPIALVRRSCPAWRAAGSVASSTSPRGSVRAPIPGARRVVGERAPA